MYLSSAKSFIKFLINLLSNTQFYRGEKGVSQLSSPFSSWKHVTSNLNAWHSMLISENFLLFLPFQRFTYITYLHLVCFIRNYLYIRMIFLNNSIFVGTMPKKLCLEKCHEFLIFTIRQVQNARKFQISMIECFAMYLRT